MDLSVKEKVESHPANVQAALRRLRGLILEVAEDNGLGPVDETLKWGELSYRVRGGSTVRIAWRPKSPDKCYVFFHCQTCLIETFKEIYGDLFLYEGNRAIVLEDLQAVPALELKGCLILALEYHRRKHLPLLGAFSSAQGKPNSRSRVI